MKMYDYDDTSEESILKYAEQFIGKSFREILELSIEYRRTSDTLTDNEATYEGLIPSKRAKGQLGNILEEHAFGYSLNSNQKADFEKTGIELKQTPIDLTKKGEMKAGERISITNISYKHPVEEDFYKSHVWEKIRKILLVHYIRDRAKESLDYLIYSVILFSPSSEDLDQIIQDYNYINQKIKNGEAHKLSEADTMYLGACTKGATAKKSLQPQYYGDHQVAKKRNYCFKQKYANYILQNYVLKKNQTQQSVIKKNSFDSKLSLESQIRNLLQKYKGMTTSQLAKRFSLNLGDKAFYASAIKAMLNVSDVPEEFQKANIQIKTIRVERNRNIREHMSFPSFSVNEILKNEWENSQLYNQLTNEKYLFVVFVDDGFEYSYHDCMFWNMPMEDIDTHARACWKATKSVLINGVTFQKSGKRLLNNLPGSSDNPCMHVRPHASKAAYLLKNGFSLGNIESDGMRLPNGEWMTKQCFWFNREYIFSVISKLLN